LRLWESQKIRLSICKRLEKSSLRWRSTPPMGAGKYELILVDRTIQIFSLWILSTFFNFCLRRSDVGVALVTPPSVLEAVWISLNVNDMCEYLRDVTLGTVRLRNTQDQQPRLPGGIVLFDLPIFSWSNWILEESSLYWKNVLQNWICVLLTERSAVRTDEICERHHYRPTSLPFFL
jgi:hypothetical protein